MSATDVFLSANPAVTLRDGAIALLVLAGVLQLLLTVFTVWQLVFDRGAKRGAVLLSFLVRSLFLGLGTALLLVVLLAMHAVIGDFAVPLPRPRDIAEVRHEGVFQELHRRIWHVLKGEVMKGYQQTEGG